METNTGARSDSQRQISKHIFVQLGDRGAKRQYTKYVSVYLLVLFVCARVCVFVCICIGLPFSRAQAKYRRKSNENKREMNVATVFKQSTSTSARMSTNIHRTELSALSSIRFDQINKKIGNNSKSNNQSIATTKAADHSKQPSAIRKQITSAILMESNSVLNIVQEPDNEYARRHRRRLSLNVRDERLLKILSAPPDEPLYISGTANNKAATINVSDNSGTGDNLYEAATSSITAVNDYENRENENLPPPPQPTDKNVVANIEGD